MRKYFELKLNTPNYEAQDIVGFSFLWQIT